MVIDFMDEKRKVDRVKIIEHMGTKTPDELKEMMAVQCLVPNTTKGTIYKETYYVDYKSIFSAFTEVFAHCWDKNGNYVARIILENFKTIKNPLV